MVSEIVEIYCKGSTIYTKFMCGIFGEDFRRIHGKLEISLPNGFYNSSTHVMSTNFFVTHSQLPWGLHSEARVRWKTICFQSATSS